MTDGRSEFCTARICTVQNGCDALEDLPRQMGAEALGGKLGRSLGAISEIVPFPLAFSYLSIDREIRPSPSRLSSASSSVGWRPRIAA